MKKETNAFIMVDKRVVQFPKTLKPIDRLVYFTMLDGADYYESKFGRYAPSIDYLMVMSGATRNTVIDSLKRLESHRLIEKTNIKGQQSIFKVFTLDERPEVLSEPNLDERRRAKLSGQPESDSNLTKNWLPTQPEFGYLPNQKLVTCKTKYKDKNIKTKEERLKESFEEESIKMGASLCDSHSCDSLGIEEAIKQSDLDDLDEESPEEALRCAQYKAEKKKKFELAKQKNKINELDDFDDSDDDFTFIPRKKVHIEPKKKIVKARYVYAGGMH
ncbi:helix-turn-helix domain-containing protein [Citrobacter braakii]|uniref:helix-turn-helix domain-containing protein n=1 Tax=Citrobacter braakii TaxID=57706 RepID=UPI004039E2EC